MQFLHRLSEDDRQRLKNGGPLNAVEQQVVRYLVGNYFRWVVVTNEPVRLEWVRDEPDVLLVYGAPQEGWDGLTRFDGERIRQLALSFLGDPDISEPDAALPWIPTVEDEAWMLEDTWVVGTK